MGQGQKRLEIKGNLTKVRPELSSLIFLRFGRKYTTVILFALTALSSFAITIGYAAKAEDAETIKRVCALVSRLFLSGAWGSLIIYTVEMFPTMLRLVEREFVHWYLSYFKECRQIAGG